MTQTIQITKISLIFIISLLFVGCLNTTTIISDGLTLIEGNGNVITEQRKTPKSFDKIDVSSILKVELEQAPDYEIIVEADDNIIPYILTEVHGGTLKIHFDNVSVKNIKEAKVYVKMPNISELRASASSEIKTEKPIKSEDLVLRTSSVADMVLAEVRAKSVVMEAGSSSDIKIEDIYTAACEIQSSSTAGIEINHIESDKIDLSASSSSDIEMDKVFTKSFFAESSSTADIEVKYIQSDKIDLIAGSSSDIKLKGKAMNLSAKTSSTATIDAKELVADNAAVSASSSSKILVHPVISLKAKASSAADIYYYNQPETIDKDTSSSGSVKKK